MELYTLKLYTLKLYTLKLYTLPKLKKPQFKMGAKWVDFEDDETPTDVGVT